MIHAPLMPNKSPVATPGRLNGWLQRRCTCDRARADDAPRITSAFDLQKKLAIGSSDDPLELEADRVADAVMGPPEGRPVVSSAIPTIQRLREPASSNQLTAPDSVNEVLSRPGVAMGGLLGDDMERRFGHDFSQVRIHTDAAAAASARDVGAAAFTVGQNIVFGSGRFAPETRVGRHLIAHELTHVLQQSPSSRTGANQQSGSPGQGPISHAAAPQAVYRQVVPGSACHPTNRWPGNMEHSLIEDDYVTNINPGNGAAEYAIPESGPNGGTGYADIVDTLRHKVYEIKTYVGAPGGVVEAERYAAKAREHCPAPIPQNPWEVGNDYPAHTIPITGNMELVVRQYAEYPGVIVYYKRRRRDVTEPFPVPIPNPARDTESERSRRDDPKQQPVPVPVPVPLPQPAMKQIRDFVRQVVQSGKDAHQAAREFLQRHPELVDLIKGTAVAIFVATLVEDLLTFGAGIADDPATMAAAAALWRVASQVAEAR